MPHPLGYRQLAADRSARGPLAPKLVPSQLAAATGCPVPSLSSSCSKLARGNDQGMEGEKVAE